MLRQLAYEVTIALDSRNIGCGRGNGRRMPAATRIPKISCVASRVLATAISTSFVLEFPKLTLSVASMRTRCKNGVVTG